MMMMAFVVSYSLPCWIFFNLHISYPMHQNSLSPIWSLGMHLGKNFHLAVFSNWDLNSEKKNYNHDQRVKYRLPKISTKLTHHLFRLNLTTIQHGLLKFSGEIECVWDYSVWMLKNKWNKFVKRVIGTAVDVLDGRLWISFSLWLSSLVARLNC